MFHISRECGSVCHEMTLCFFFINIRKSCYFRSNELSIRRSASNFLISFAQTDFTTQGIENWIILGSRKLSEIMSFHKESFVLFGKGEKEGIEKKLKREKMHRE